MAEASVCREQKTRSKLRQGKYNNVQNKVPSKFETCGNKTATPSAEIQLKNRYRILAFGWKDEYVPAEETTRPTGLNSQEEKTLSISLLSVGN